MSHKYIVEDLDLVRVVVVELLSLKETDADEQGNQLTTEEIHDCCSLHETLIQRTNDGSWHSFIELRGEKKNETSGRRIENNRNVVVITLS